ncbi:MAG TPA: KH domain-containing protein [Phototrophicaceae bacterium]|nr:KH domain-containing protein [Phototrophicaceae bacterium]
MEQLIEYIAKSLVDDPAAVKVFRRVSGGTLVLELHVAQEDTGRVIGKGGHVANAMRALLRASADERYNKVILKIV